MHSEWGEIGADVAARINDTHAAGGRVVAVGTTSLRLLESAATDDGTVRPFTGETAIFITPGYRFRAVDMLLTNRSEEHTSELQSLMRISYAVFCLKKKKQHTIHTATITRQLLHTKITTY